VTEAVLTTPSARISSVDRLCFTLFLAVALHAMLIIGISFSFDRNSATSPSIEVTLSNTASKTAPEEADFAAEDNQEGGGLLNESALPSVTQLSEHVSQETNNTTPEAPIPSQRAQAPQKSQVVTTTAANADKALQIAKIPSPKNKLEQLREEISLQEQSMGLVSRDAKLDIYEQFLTKERTLKVNSVATLKARDAFYVRQWIDKIERTGLKNYPNEALRRGIEGSLVLTVLLLPDGTIRELKIARSSGHKILDDAAINIVRRVGTFAPFSAEMKKHYDQLEITRKWQFSKDGKTPLLSAGKF